MLKTYVHISVLLSVENHRVGRLARSSGVAAVKPYLEETRRSLHRLGYQ